MYQRTIAIHQDYLHIPLHPGLTPHYALQIWLDGTLVRECYLAISAEEPEAYFFMNVSSFTGKNLTLILPKPDDLDKNVLERIVNGGAAQPGNPLYPDLYLEPMRPKYHFSTKRGWLNDPNGLIYAHGVYHMYYQHNPFGTYNGSVNVCWGHATSPDLIHWTELDDAIKPWRRDCFIASGSAILDEHNHAGYGKNTMIAAFTALGTHNEIPGRHYPSGGQFLAASTDGGNLFHLISTQAIVPTENGEGWRDPRIFAYEDHYVMAVYEVEDGCNCVSFYVSNDLLNWTRTSRNMNLYECPDVFPLTDSQGNTRWILYGADGKARIGSFDGYAFTESGDANPLDYGKATYAGQTWSNHPTGKRIHISWVIGVDGLVVEDSFPGMPFSQCMSIPCELTLQCLDGTYRVLRNPTDEVKCLRTAPPMEEKLSFDGTYHLPLLPAADYEMKITMPDEGTLCIQVGAHAIQYNASTKTLHFENGQESQITGDTLAIRMLVDTTTMELFFNEGVAASYTMLQSAMSFQLSGQGTLALRQWALQSILPV